MALTKVLYVIGNDPEYCTLFVLYKPLIFGVLTNEWCVLPRGDMESRHYEFTEAHGFDTVDDIERWLKEEYPGSKLINQTYKKGTND